MGGLFLWLLISESRGAPIEGYSWPPASPVGELWERNRAECPNQMSLLSGRCWIYLLPCLWIWYRGVFTCPILSNCTY